MQTKNTAEYNAVITEDLLDDYGHVNNARYLELYERARWDVLKKSGLGNDYVRESKTGPVILEVTVRFKRELTRGDTITIITSSRKKGDRIFYFDQIMKNNAGEIYSQAVFTVALFDLEKGK